jgi:uncharacterized protein YukE
MARAISVDPTWIADYARTAEQAADDLAAALRALTGAPLTSAAFGDVGRVAGSADAYRGAADALRQQVSHAVDALHTVATNLRGITAQHSSADEQRASAIKSAHRN